MLDYVSFLDRQFQVRRSRNPRYSLRAMAGALGVDVAVLSRAIRGVRVPSFEIADRMAANLALSPEDHSAFLNSVAEAQKARSLARTMLPRRPLPQAKFERLEIDLFRIIGDWYHYALLELTRTEGFRPDPRWIACQLGISVAQAKLAISRLLKLGLLEQSGNELRKSKTNVTTAERARTSSALKRHQGQLLRKAKQSLERDPVEERNFLGMTMAIDPADLPKARKRLEQFAEKLCQELEGGKRRRVYQLSLCLFPLQKKPTRR